jgi:hypothetical protein
VRRAVITLSAMARTSCVFTFRTTPARLHTAMTAGQNTEIDQFLQQSPTTMRK